MLDRLVIQWYTIFRRLKEVSNLGLDELLFKYFKSNNEDSYSKLIELLYDLNKLGVLNNVNEVVDWLDENRSDSLNGLEDNYTIY